MEKKPVYQEVLETILKALVNNPEDVKVVRTLDEMGVLLSVKVHPQDMGIVIGNRGETIKAIRNLIKVIGNRHYARVNIKLLEPTVLEKAISQKETSETQEKEEKISGEEIISELKSELQQEK
jgi:predicted RNA-binding protein YlqC (UPF0109 family)